MFIMKSMIKSFHKTHLYNLKILKINEKTKIIETLKKFFYLIFLYLITLIALNHNANK